MAKVQMTAPDIPAHRVISHGGKVSAGRFALRNGRIQSQGRTIAKQQNTDSHWPMAMLRGRALRAFSLSAAGVPALGRRSMTRLMRRSPFKVTTCRTGARSPNFALL